MTGQEVAGEDRGRGGLPHREAHGEALDECLHGLLLKGLSRQSWARLER